MQATYTDIYSGLLQIVIDVDKQMPIIIRGAPAPSLADKDEWIVFDILSITNGVARRNTIEQYVDIQLICYAKHATQRADNKFNAIYALADKYGELFHRKDVLIKNTCIQFKENKMIPLDLRSTGDFAKEILNSLPPLHTMSMVILNQGIISSNKEG